MFNGKATYLETISIDLMYKSIYIDFLGERLTLYKGTKKLVDYIEVILNRTLIKFKLPELKPIFKQEESYNDLTYMYSLIKYKGDKITYGKYRKMREEEAEEHNLKLYNSKEWFYSEKGTGEDIMYTTPFSLRKFIFYNYMYNHIVFEKYWNNETKEGFLKHFDNRFEVFKIQGDYGTIILKKFLFEDKNVKTQEVINVL
mgnify:CR=1 FL=1